MNLIIKRKSCIEAKVKYVSFFRIGLLVSLIITLVNAMLLFRFTDTIVSVVYFIAGTSLVAFISCCYFYNQNYYNYFQISRGLIKKNQFVLHLSRDLVVHLKKMDETVGRRGSASKYLHDEVYQQPYLEALAWCFILVQLEDAGFNI